MKMIIEKVRRERKREIEIKRKGMIKKRENGKTEKRKR